MFHEGLCSLTLEQTFMELYENVIATRITLQVAFYLNKKKKEKINTMCNEE